MTCLAGIASVEPRAEIASEVGQMMNAWPRQTWYRESSFADRHGKYAVATLFHGFSKIGSTKENESEATRSLTLFGDVYRMPAGTHDVHSRFAHEYDSHGPSFLSSIQGAFIASMYDPDTGVVEVANDRFAQRTLYYHVDRGVLRFSTSLAGLFAVGVPASISPNGVSQFFSFGQHLGCDTMYQDIQVLQARSVLRFNTNDGSLEIESYDRGTDVGLGPKSDQEWLVTICEATVSAVQQASAETEGLGLALSGGLDARTILGLIDHSNVDLKTVCLGMPGSMDLRCAEKMSSMLGCQHHAHLLDDAFLQDFESHLNRMVDLTGGQYLSQCIVIPTLPVYRQQGINVLLRGHAGELMHMSKAYSYSLDEEAMSIASRAEAKAWLYKHLRAYIVDGLQGDLFQGEFSSAMKSAPQEAFDKVFEEIPELDDARQAIWHSFVNDRLRRETTLSLGKFASVCDVRVPFLDGRLIDLLLAAPIELKTDETIQRYILQRCRPELLSVVNANVGAAMTAGPWMQKFGYLRMRVLAKLGVKGYQPYERLGLWLRRELDELVRRVLLDDECLDRGVFNPDIVRQVIRNHGNKSANHTFLILAMLIFEVGQRRVCRRSTEFASASM